MKKKPANSIEPLYRVLIIIFSFVSLILIALIMYFTLSQATIVITPSYQNQRIGFAVQITGNENETGSGKIFGEVKEIEVTANKKFPSTSTIVNSDKASGVVTFINNSKVSQVLVATTRLLTTDNKLYRLDKTITVPAEGKITANATADATGDQFITSAEKLTIPGLNPVKQAQIWAETAGFFKQSRTINQLTTETVNQARNKLKEELIVKAQDELKKQLANPDNLLTEALQINVIEDKNDAKINSNQAEFTVTMKIKVKGLSADKEALQKIATANLKDIYQNSQTILKIRSDSFTYQTTFLDLNTENLLAQVKGEYELAVVNIQIDKEQLKGMKQIEAITKIKNLSGVKDVAVYLPFWTKYLPALSEKINIQVKQ